MRLKTTMKEVIKKKVEDPSEGRNFKVDEDRFKPFMERLDPPEERALVTPVYLP